MGVQGSSAGQVCCMSAPKGESVSGLNKGIERAQVTLRWDPSPLGETGVDLDIIAGTYTSADPYGTPDYLVHFDSRAPDGTIVLSRDSTTGQGFGPDESMTLDLYRLAERYVRVVVGVAIQQRSSARTFGEVENPQVEIHEGPEELAVYDFSAIPKARAATVGEFYRNEFGAWAFRAKPRGFDADPGAFTRQMGSAES